jgi:gamma-glutamyl phosphate reductase
VLVNASPRIVEGEGLGGGAALGVAAPPVWRGGPVTLDALTTTRVSGDGRGWAR